MLKSILGSSNQDSKVPFRQQYDLNHRKDASQHLIQKYSDMYPLIVEYAQNSSANKGISISKTKYLARKDQTMGSVLNAVRGHIQGVKPEEGLCWFVNSTTHGTVMLPISSNVSQVYEKYKWLDGFLYVLFSVESVFGTV